MKYLVATGMRQVRRVVGQTFLSPNVVVLEKRSPKVNYKRVRQFQQNVLNSEADARTLRFARPAYWTSAGRQTFALERIEVGRNGRIVGIFMCRYYSWEHRGYVTDRYLYGVQNGAPRELREMARVVG